MAKAKSVQLGVVNFRTTTEAHDHFHEILQSYNVNDRVSDEDAAKLGELLKRHPDYAAKAGVGISHFTVIAADFGSQCFAVHRTDGSHEDFSYKKCL